MKKVAKNTESDAVSSPKNDAHEEEQGISPEVQAWSEKVLAHISRMAVDEKYRKQATSFLP
jgi:hypothetical protein